MKTLLERLLRVIAGAPEEHLEPLCMPCWDLAKKPKSHLYASGRDLERCSRCHKTVREREIVWC